MKILLFWFIIIISIISWLTYIIYFSFYMESWFIGITLGSLIYTIVWIAFYGLTIFFLSESKIVIKIIVLGMYSILILLTKKHITYGYIAVMSAWSGGFFQLSLDMSKKGIEMNVKKHFTKVNVYIYVIISSVIAISLFLWVMCKYNNLLLAISSLPLGFIIGAFFWLIYVMFIYAKAVYKSLMN